MKDYDLLRLKSFMSTQHKLVISFYVDQEPFKKGKSTNGSSARRALTKEFERSLKAEMTRKKLTNFKTDIAIDFHFSSSKNNHPDHANLIKNYIDIIRDNLLDDDRQVSVIESYHSLPRSGYIPKGSLRVSISPLGLYNAKNSLIGYYSDSSDTPFSNRQSNENMSPSELVESYKNLMEYSKDKDNKDKLQLLMDKAEEEKVLGHLWPWDFPFELKKPGQEGWLGLDDMLNKCRSDQRGGIIIALPYKNELILKSIQEYFLKVDVKSIKAHTSLDINLEVINWHEQDIDNIFLDVKKVLFNSNIYTGNYTGIRIYRYDDSIDLSPRLKIKLLPPMEISFHIHNLEESVKSAFKED